MTTAGATQADLVEQLADTWEATVDLLAGLDPPGWERPTDLPGWTVRDVVSHMIGTESMLAGRETPPAPDRRWSEHVKNDIGALNEAWVDARRDRLPSEILAEFRIITSERLGALQAMTAEELDAPSWTPVGNATYRRFMQIRVFDCWVHEQDIRRAVGRPGHEGGPAAEASLDEVERSLGYVVGKLAQAPAGSRISFDLTGPSARRIHVAVDTRAAVVEGLDRPADVTITLAATDFVALGCGRVAPGAVPVACSGDEALGAQVCTHLAFTI